jgi:oxygen-dependent protoporphyrinogen oxidase
MSQLIDRLSASLVDHGVTFEFGRPAEELPIRPGHGSVVSVPAHVAAGLVAPWSPTGASILGAIEFSSVVFVTLVFDRASIDPLPDGSGFLVPRSAGRRVTAASWMSSKWPHLDIGDRVIIRASLGHIDDPEPIGWDDATVLATVRTELADAMGIAVEPRAHRVARYPDAFPHYDVGHLDRMADLAATLAVDRPDIEVCGMAHGGVGIPACIRSGRQAASRLRERLSQ